jgi:hypothetical protein
MIGKLMSLQANIMELEEYVEYDEAGDSSQAEAMAMYNKMFRAGLTRESLQGVYNLIKSSDCSMLFHDSIHRTMCRIVEHNLHYHHHKAQVSDDPKYNNRMLKDAGLKMSDRRRILRTLSPGTVGQPIYPLICQYLSDRINLV